MRLENYLRPSALAGERLPVLTLSRRPSRLRAAKLDDTIRQSAATRLAALGYDVDTVLDDELGGRSDEDVWAAAQA